jgi:hypothetical protein
MAAHWCWLVKLKGSWRCCQGLSRFIELSHCEPWYACSTAPACMLKRLMDPEPPRKASRYTRPSGCTVLEQGAAGDAMYMYQ